MYVVKCRSLVQIKLTVYDRITNKCHYLFYFLIMVYIYYDITPIECRLSGSCVKASESGWQGPGFKSRMVGGVGKNEDHISSGDKGECRWF